MTNEIEKVLYEVRANRYLMSTILTNVYSLLDALKERDKVLSRLIPLQMKEQMQQIYDNVECIKFEFFQLKPEQFKVLCDEFGNDIVTDCAIVIDSYIRRTGRHYRNYYTKMKQLCKEMKQKQEIKEDLSNEIRKIRAIDYKTITDKELAKRYIESTPEYYRNVDKACVYLKERFEL